MTKKILVTGSSVRDDLLRPLVDAGYQVANPTHLLSEDELQRELEGAVAYLVGGDEYASKTAVSTAKGLRIIAFLGVGYQSFIDADAAAHLNIPVTNTPGTLAQSVAEFTIGQALNATRRLAVYGRYYRGHQANAEEKRHDLGAASVGLIGLGSIGTRIAEILTAGFGARLSYYSRTRKQADEVRLGIAYKELPELMTSSSIVFVMVPGNDTTKGLLGASELSRLPKNAILVNTARPNVVDPAALLTELQSGRIETAVFDDFYDDAVPQTAALLALPEDRLLLTRHIASLTHEARDGMAIKAVQSILNVLRTGSDEYIINGVNNNG